MTGVIVQGDQYSIPVVVKQGNTIFTDQNVTGIKIAFGNTTCAYPEGNLVYANGAWQYPLTQKVSLAFPGGKTDFQVQVKIGDQIIGTYIKKVDVMESIIKGEW